MTNDFIMWSPGVTLEAIEKQVILKAFRHFRGNKTSTAQALGISVRGLDNKLEKYENDGKEQANRDAVERAKREDFLARSRGLHQSASGGFIPAETEGQGGGNVPSPAPRERVEPALDVTSQHAVPVPERQKVQTVLPKHSSKSSSR